MRQGMLAYYSKMTLKMKTAINEEMRCRKKTYTFKV